MSLSTLFHLCGGKTLRPATLLVGGAVWGLLICAPPLFASSAASAHGDRQTQRGFEYFREGHFAQAALAWAEASGTYEAANQWTAQAYALVYLARAMYHLGQYQDAQASLGRALALAQKMEQRRLVAIALGQAGTVARALGHHDRAIALAKKGLGIARDEEDSALVAALLNDFGNALAAQGKTTEALGAYIEAAILAEASGDEPLAARSHINAAMTAIHAHQYRDAKERLDMIADVMSRLPASHEHAHGWLNVGLAYGELLHVLPGERDALLIRTAEAFHSAAMMAEELGDSRAESYGWGFLGHLYEREQRYDEALALTARAVLAAQRANAPESLYRWEWQSGRIHRASGRLRESILAYRRAMDTIQPIRRELSFAAGDGPKSFRESVAPLFFELAALLLQQTEMVTDEKARQVLLRQVRDTMEGFKAAELQDYFRDDCVEAVQSRIATLDTVSETTAVLYPIIFPDRVEMLVSLGGSIVRVTIPVDRRSLIPQVNSFRRLLEKRTTHQYLPHAQRLYDLLIRPLDPNLRQHEIETLVLVPDGVLRTIPFGALHDGEQFLIERYALAVTPGLTLTDPQPIDRKRTKFLSVGLTEGVQGFPPLPHVGDEVTALQRLYGGQMLLNRRFQVANLERALRKEQFTIVHVASHGQFEPDVANSFILAFDGRLTMDTLDELIGLFQFRETPLDLLTLSACETAVGDDRAALGLAGLAIKAGARSALATLWLVNDRAASNLIEEFYTRLRDPSISKAVALQRAQLALLEHPTYRHPGYWSPFLLINNWL